MSSSHTAVSASHSVGSLHRAEALSAGLPPLMIAADRIASTVSQGIHGRRQVGYGETFWQFRRYQSGDSVHNIDWRQSGKSQRVYIRQNEWAVAQSVWLGCDCSASMMYASSDRLPEKADRARILALALASLLIRGNECVALLGSERAPSNSRAGLSEMALALISATASSTTQGTWLKPGSTALPRHARLVIFSDFLDDPAILAENMNSMVGQGVQGILVRIIDPAEETLPYEGRVLFEGFEREGKALIERVEDARPEYQKHWQAHEEQLAEIARVANWHLVTHHTDRSPVTLLLHLCMLMSDHGFG